MISKDPIGALDWVEWGVEDGCPSGDICGEEGVEAHSGGADTGGTSEAEETTGCSASATSTNAFYAAIFLTMAARLVNGAKIPTVLTTLLLLS